MENKIPDASGIGEKADYNTKITEIESKVPDVSSLATRTALTTVGNKIPSINNLVNLIMTQKLLKLKRNLLIIIMINVLQLQSLIL